MLLIGPLAWHEESSPAFSVTRRLLGVGLVLSAERDLDRAQGVRKISTKKEMQHEKKEMHQKKEGLRKLGWILADDCHMERVDSDRGQFVKAPIRFRVFPTGALHQIFQFV